MTGKICLAGTLLAPFHNRTELILEESDVSKKLLTVLAIAILTVGGAACAKNDNANANLNATGAVETRQAADNSEITTTTDASGVKTETRVFRNNPRVSKVVVTTHPKVSLTVSFYSKTG
jgi:hypothetical protein